MIISQEAARQFNWVVKPFKIEYVNLGLIAEFDESNTKYVFHRSSLTGLEYIKSIPIKILDQETERALRTKGFNVVKSKADYEFRNPEWLLSEDEPIHVYVGLQNMISNAGDIVLSKYNPFANTQLDLYFNMEYHDKLVHVKDGNLFLKNKLI